MSLLVAERQTAVVDVWHAKLDAVELVAAMMPLLSSDELARGRRFRFERDRDRFFAARGTLRAMLAQYLETDATTLRFAYGPSGKPALAGPAVGSHLHFNVSHADGMGVFAFSYAGAVGVDVEFIRPIPEIDQLSARYFSPEECAALRRMNSTAERTAGFFRCWTRKEAFIKALGEGLSRPLDSFSVTVDSDEDVKLEWIEEHPDAAARWTLQHFDLSSRCIGAVAIEVPNASIQLRQGQLSHSGAGALSSS